MLLGLCSAIFFAYLISLTSNPSLANVGIDEQGAGMEAVGILSFLLKSLLRMGPILYGSWAILAALFLAYAVVGYAMDTNESFLADMMLELRIMAALFTLAAALLVPIVMYVLFLFYHLAVDIIRSILALPAMLSRVN